jgi:hypothetical protein
LHGANGLTPLAAPWEWRGSPPTDDTTCLLDAIAMNADLVGWRGRSGWHQDRAMNDACEVVSGATQSSGLA